MKPTYRHKPPPPQEFRLPVPAIMMGLEPNARGFNMGECVVYIGSTPATGWHLSISHKTRYPTWDEINYARQRLVPPNITMAMIIPAQGQEYVNIHSNCFHLWEIEDKGLK